MLIICFFGRRVKLRNITFRLDFLRLNDTFSILSKIVLYNTKFASFTVARLADGSACKTISSCLIGEQSEVLTFAKDSYILNCYPQPVNLGNCSEVISNISGNCCNPELRF